MSLSGIQSQSIILDSTLDAPTYNKTNTFGNFVTPLTRNLYIDKNVRFAVTFVQCPKNWTNQVSTDIHDYRIFLTCSLAEQALFHSVSNISRPGPGDSPVRDAIFAFAPVPVTQSDQSHTYTKKYLEWYYIEAGAGRTISTIEVALKDSRGNVIRFPGSTPVRIGLTIEVL